MGSLVQEHVHPRGLDFHNQRSVIIWRDKGLPWWEVRLKVRNREGSHPSETHCQEIYEQFNRRRGNVKHKYNNCGRKPWKLTKPIQKLARWVPVGSGS